MEALRPGDPERVGPYRLLARLGAGGMGVVYLGRSPGGRAVAVKVVTERFAADFGFRARFRREVAAAREVTGGSTAVVLDADPEADRPWLVTAYLPGVTLREAVRTAGPLPPAALRVVAAAGAEALVDIHRAGLVHRDLKPANVMVTADGIRVIDFGIARPDDATAITRVGTVVGTPGFMSPEQVSGAEVGPPSDVFSLGSVLMFAATGEEPFRSDAVAVTLHRVLNVDADLDAIADPWLRGLVAACLRADPARRPTATDLLGRIGATAPVADGDWLPPALAEEIDRRAAGPTVAAPTVPAAVDAPAGEPDHLDGPTIDPPVTAAPVSRRRLVLGGAAFAVVAGGAAAGAALRGGKDTPSTTTTTATTRPAPTPTAPPQAAERWRAQVSAFYPEELFAVPGIVLARTGEDELIALDAASGGQLWKLGASSVGTVSGGLVFQQLNTNPELALVDPATGVARWKTRQQFPGDHPLRLVVCGPVVAWGMKEVRAQSLADGRTRWVAPVPSSGGLATVAGLLVAAGGTEVVALDASSGQARWRFAVENPWFLTAGAGMVIFVDPANGLFALRAADGSLAWSKPDFGMSAWPVVAGSTVYAGSGSGRVFAVDAATGDTRWATALGTENRVEVAGGTVCAATPNRVTYGLSAADGRVRWTYSGEVGVRPAMANCAMTSLDGRFYIGVREGAVVALAPPEGGRGAGS